MQLRISEICIYPVKSLSGISLSESEIGLQGLAFDRRWMIVDEAGTFISQRRFPELALLSVAMEKGNLSIENRLNPGRSLSVPMEGEGERKEVSVWSSQLSAADCGEEAAAFFSDFLNFPVRLVKMADYSVRKVDEQFAPGHQTGFADGFPILLMNMASLEALNDRMPEPVTMKRFRPNLVLSGGEAFAEDSWKVLRSATVELKAVKPCARCVLVNVDPAKGVAGKEPLKTLSGFRTFGGKVLFGQNLTVEKPGKIAIGDSFSAV